LAGHPKDPAGFDTGQFGFGVCPEFNLAASGAVVQPTCEWLLENPSAV
jgi:hypothetical protein